MHSAKWALAAAGGWVAACCLAASAAGGGESEMKQASVFYPARLRARARANAKNHPWAAAIRGRVVAAAGPWMKLSDDRLWSLVFAPTISRSWMVWSNGHCPACEKSVPMYNWRMAPLKRPWKVQCPHCDELFPKNDFGKFCRSGLDARGVFDPARGRS